MLNLLLVVCLYIPLDDVGDLKTLDKYDLALTARGIKTTQHDVIKLPTIGTARGSAPDDVRMEKINDSQSIKDLMIVSAVNTEQPGLDTPGQSL